MRENINPKERFSEEGHRLSTFILNLILHVDGHSSLDLELLFLIFSGIIELIQETMEDEFICIIIFPSQHFVSSILWIDFFFKGIIGVIR